MKDIFSQIVRSSKEGHELSLDLKVGIIKISASKELKFENYEEDEDKEKRLKDRRDEAQTALRQALTDPLSKKRREVRVS